ncbi:MAG: hypothetical protein HC867_05965 [Bacteroidia bacterium]|nr:hypothetical protein [Bacteroidia bacterium]
MKKVTYTIGGKKGATVELNESKNLVAVRTRDDKTLQKSLTQTKSKELSQKLRVKQKLPRANVIVLEVKKTEINPLAIRNKVRETYKKEKDIRFAGRVLVDAVSKEPVLYTENIYLKFHDAIIASLLLTRCSLRNACQMILLSKESM